MTRIAVALAFCLLAESGSAQNFGQQLTLEQRCATPHPTNPADQIATPALARRAGTITIPVVYHVIEHTNGSGSIPDQWVNDQHDVLRSAYASTMYDFRQLAIIRTQNASWYTATNGSSAEQAMKEDLAIDPRRVLNVYINNPANGALGWATFPWSYPENDKRHGVVLYNQTLPGGNLVISAGSQEPDGVFTYNLGDTLPHEAGHYLGLYHTFSGGCSAPGDEVADTPYQASGNNIFYCRTQDTCPQQPGNDPINNYMGYCDDVCMTTFTSGQLDRMDAILQQEKPSLGQRVDVLTSNRTETNKTYTGQMIYIPEGRTLTLNGTTNLNTDVNGRPSDIFVFGLLNGSGTINLNGGSEIFVFDDGILDFDGDINIGGLSPWGNVSCIMAKKGGEVIFNNGHTVTFSSDGFLAAKAGGVFTVEDYATVIHETSAGGLVVDPGATFRLGKSASLVFDRPVTIAGTASAPVRFERLNPADKWQYVKLEGDGSTISHARFDGGVYGLYLNGAQNVSIDHSIFSDGTYGLYLYNAEVDAFVNNTVYDNTSRGIYLSYSSTLRMDGSAYNRVYNNGSHEVYIGSQSARLYAGSGSSNRGNNAIYDHVNTSGYYVYNLALTGTGNWTVPAEYNWWGASAPPAGKFYGSVDTAPYLTSDPGQIFMASATGGASGGASERSAETGASLTLAIQNSDALQVTDPETITPSVVHQVHDALLRHTPPESSSVYQSAEAFLGPLRSYLVSGDLMRGEASRTHLASELAATFHVGDLVAEGRYAEAESAAAEFGPHITNADYRVELLLSQAVLYEATGRYADALAAIEAAEAVGPEADVVDYDAPDYTPVKDDLRSALMVVSSGLSEAKASTTSVPEETALGAPYPNPFRGYAEIPFQIGENGRATVEVYDLVGRRIAVLAAGEPVSAGMRTYTLDGAGLATGVYIVRAVLHTDGGATRTFSQKVSLLR